MKFFFFFFPAHRLIGISPAVITVFTKLTLGLKRTPPRKKKFCQEWDLNPRSFEPAPEAGALDRSAILTRFIRQIHAVILVATIELLQYMFLS